MLLRLIEDILCIAVLLSIPNFLCEKLGVYTSCQKILERRNKRADEQLYS